MMLAAPAKVGRGSPRLPWLPLALATGLGGLDALLGPAPHWLLFEPSGSWSAEPWRLVTGHLVHADHRHLAWNLGAFLLLGGLAERWCGFTPWRLSGLLLASALAIDLWLRAFEPGLGHYAGLSGVLNGLFAALAIALWRQSRSPWALALLLGDLAKIAVEASLGGSLLATSSWQPVPGAHFAGLLAGVLWAVWPTGRTRRPPEWRSPVASVRSSAPWLASIETPSLR